MALARGFFEPAASLVMVDRDEPSGGVKIAERDLRLRDPLLRRPPVPFQTLFRIVRDPLALEQHDRQIVLRDALALLRRAAEPGNRQIEILLHAPRDAVQR